MKSVGLLHSIHLTEVMVKLPRVHKSMLIAILRKQIKSHLA